MLYSFLRNSILVASLSCGAMVHAFAQTAYVVVAGLPSSIGQINLKTASYQAGSPTTDNQTGLPISFLDIAFLPSGVLYGITADGTLYTVNAITGSSKKTGKLSLSIAINSITFDLQGNLYGVSSSSNNLFKINLQDFNATVIGSFCCSPGSASGITFQNGKMYVIGLNKSLIEISLKNGLLDASKSISTLATVAGGSFNALATSADGNVFASDTNGFFYKINIATGKVDIIPVSGGVKPVGIAFDLEAKNSVEGVDFEVIGKQCMPDAECGGDSLEFKILGITSSQKWNFGDTAAPQGNTSVLPNPKHWYANAGTYRVKLVFTVNSQTDSLSKDIIINQLPLQPDFGRADTTICESERGKLILNPYLKSSPPANVAYSWYKYGQTTPAIKVDSSGCYSVQVTDTLTQCSISARIQVKICAEKKAPEGGKWFFGNNAGIDFAGGQPKAIGTGKLNTIEGVSAITNKEGKLLFYTDGIRIYDKGGNLMPSLNPADIDTLRGNKNATQSVIIVPQPACRGCETSYYIFTTSDINSTDKTMYYSIVDMRKNNGKGAVVKKNIPLYSPSTERLTSIMNPKDSTYWVITHDYGNNSFRIYNVTKSGLVQKSVLPLGLSQNTTDKGEGYIKIAPSGNKVAIAVPGPPRNYVEVFEFNDSTGVMKKSVQLDLGVALPKVYGIEFSPDGKKMYVSMAGDSAQKAASLLYQFDVSSKDSATVAGSKMLLDSVMNQKFGALQFAPDGKIYLAIQGSSSLGVVANPAGGSITDIAYQRNGFNLGGKLSQLGLPNLVQSNIEQNSGPSLMAPDTVCAGDPADMQGSPICSPKKEKVIEWKFGDGATALLPIAIQQHTYTNPGVYTISLREANDCKDTTMTKTITVLAKPKPDLGQNIDVCKKTATLNANISTPNAQFYWFKDNKYIPGQYTSTLIVTLSGKYEVRVLMGDCESVASVNVILRQPPVLNLGKDSIICIGSLLSLNAGINTANNLSYKWNTGAITQKILVSQAGNYSVVITDDNTKCSNADTINVAIRQRPLVVGTITPTSNCNANDGSVNITAITPQSNYTLAWYKNGTLLPTTGIQIQNLGIGTYSVRVHSANSCDTTAYFSVNQANQTTQIAVDKVTPATCQNPHAGQVILTIKGIIPNTFIVRKDINSTPIQAGSFASVASGSTVTFNGLSAGDYAFEFSDANNCKTIATIHLSLSIPTFLNIAPNQRLCEGDSLQLNPSINTNYTYLWNTGATTPSITVKQTAIYSVTVTEKLSGCQSLEQVSVRAFPKPQVSAGKNEDICGNAPSFKLLGNNPIGGKWQGKGVDSTGFYTPTLLNLGTNILTYIVQQNGCVGQATKALLIKPVPPAALGADRKFCEGEIESIGTFTVPEATYKWSNGETTPIIKPKIEGTYILTASLNGCKDSDTIAVKINPKPKLLNIKNNVPLCIGDYATAVLDAGVGIGWRYLWIPTGDTTRRLTISKQGAFIIRVTNTEGCSAEQPIIVEDLCEAKIYVPDIFTPNNDGFNESLVIFSRYVTNFDLKIYNRWGEVIFATNDITERWDGTYKGEKCPTDSYAWKIDYRSIYYPERSLTAKRGVVLLVR